MILTDGVHLVSDEDLRELHWFALRAGIHRTWFHGGHYDIITDTVARLVGDWDIEVVSTREIVRRRCKR